MAVTSRLWAGYFVAAIAAFAVAAPGGPVAHALLGAFLGLASTGALAAGIYIFGPRPARPWQLLAAGQLCFAMGDLAAALAGSPIDRAAFPSPAQLLYLAGYPIVTLGFAQLVVRRPLGASWTVLLDGGILTAGIALLAWVVFADPILAIQGLSRVDRAVELTFIVCDIALVGVLVCLYLGSETHTGSIRMFVASGVALLVGDGVARASGLPAGSLWAAAAAFVRYGLWGAAALHPTMARPAALKSDDTHRLTTGRVVALVASCLVAPAMLAMQGVTGSPVDYFAISVGGVVIVLLAVTSMADMVQEQTAAAEKQLALEEKFRQTSETLRAILDSSPLAIVVVDRHRRVLFWSRAAESLFGYRADEILGHRSPIVPQEQSEGRALIPRVLAGASVVEQELPSRTKDGRPINIRAHFAPIADEAGRVLGAISLMEDTSELDRLQHELFEASKLESVGRLAGGIAHDFNNILTAILGYADISLEEPPETDISEYVTGIRDAAERAAGLTQQLLAFSRRQVLQPQVLAINDVASGVESMLRRLISEQIELKMDLDPSAGYLRADRTQLEQVILNLTLNARDAMPKGGRLVLRTGHVHYSNLSRSRPRELALGDYVTISVTDTGTGMNAETREHIFEPFWTTKGQGKGTGLGLATTYGIIKQSGGSVIVDSEPGCGTTFRIYFPTVVREAVPVREGSRRSDGVAARAVRSGRILLVEDEDRLRGIAQRVLARAGFDVTAACGPDEAILAAESMTAPLDLLVTDVVMPEMRGPELAQRLRNRQPGLKVLLVSGYAQEIVEGGGDRSMPFLAKPFTKETLLAAVDRAMGAGDEEREDGEESDESDEGDDRDVRDVLARGEELVPAASKPVTN